MSKGIDFENQIKHFFERRGYTVFRQAKSCFPDLIAVKRYPNNTIEWLLIECKKGQKEYANTLSPRERSDLLIFQEQFGAIPIHAKQIKVDGFYQSITFALINK